MRIVALLHPPLIALATVLYVAIKYLHSVYWEQILYSSVVAVAVFAAIAAVLLQVLKQPGKAALTTSVLAVISLNYGRWYDDLLDKHYELSAFTLHVLTAAPLAILAILALVVIWRFKSDLLKTSVVATAAAIIVVVYYAAQVGQRDLAFSPPPQGAPQRSVAALDENSRRLPDIYFLVLDGYVRDDVMRWVYRYENSEFINSLEERGFYVAAKSYSNYTTTYLSLAATFDMDYLDDENQALIDAHGLANRSRGVFYDKIRKPEVARFLQAKGYRYVTSSTNWPGTWESDLADTVFYYPSVFRDRFYNGLLAATVLRFQAPGVADMHEFTLRRVRDVVAIDGPTFAFFHFLMPHNPYVVDRNGKEILHLPLALHFSRRTGGWRVKQPYVEQVRAVNRQMLSLIDHIVAESPVPPIIVLQGDHGTATIRKPPGPEQGSRKLPIAEERLAILNAMLVPEGVHAKLYPSISPINTFRVILTEQFGAELELLEDRHFFSWYNKPQLLIDESKRLAELQLDAQYFETVMKESSSNP